MNDERELLERELKRFTPEPGILERVTLRRERKRHQQRLAAGALGVVMTGALIAAAVLTLRSQEPDPADSTPTPPPAVSTPPPTTSRPPAMPSTALPEPLVELPQGYHFVDVRTGEATPMPASIMAVEGAGNFEVSPDGSMILFDNAGVTTGANQPADLGHHQLYVADIDGSDLRQLTDDPVGASLGSWSPDGTKVVFLGGWAKVCCGDNPADLTVMDVETGAVERLAHGTAFDFYEPFFSPDGNRIHFTRWNLEERPDLWTIPVDGGPPELLLEDLGWAKPSPDGTSLIYPWIESFMVRAGNGVGHCGGDYGVLWISDADGSDPRRLAPRAADDLRGTGAGAGWSPDGTRIAYAENLVAPDPCQEDFAFGVYVMDVGTGDRTLIAFGFGIDWLDDHTVLVQARRPGRL